MSKLPRICGHCSAVKGAGKPKAAFPQLAAELKANRADGADGAGRANGADGTGGMSGRSSSPQVAESASNPRTDINIPLQSQVTGAVAPASAQNARELDHSSTTPASGSAATSQLETSPKSLAVAITLSTEM